MFKSIRKICANRNESIRRETELVSDAILTKITERLEMVEMFHVRGDSVLHVPVGKSVPAQVLKTVRAVLEKADLIPAWTTVDVTVWNGKYKIRISAH